MVPLENFVRSVGCGDNRETGDGTITAEPLLFSSGGSGLDAVEILALKLMVFAQAVRGVHEHYRMFGRAHLDVNSETLVVAPGDSVSGLPTLWNFQVRLETTSALDTLELGHGINVALPPADPVAPFFPPSIRDFMLTGHRVGEFAVERLVEDDGGSWRMEGQLIDPRGVFPRPDEADWISLRWAEDPVGLGVSETAARIDPRKSGKAGGKQVFISTEPLRIDRMAVERIQRAGGVQLPNVAYRVYPHFGARDDLYSLGLVLFLCVLVNDSQDLGLIMDDLGLMGLQTISEGEWLERAREQVGQHPDTWGANAVLFESLDREVGRPNAIPDRLWLEVLALGMRLVAGSGGVVATDGGDPSLFERVEAEVENLIGRLRALLFDHQPRNLEIQSVISELLSSGHTEG
jgi:hypothetical protein